MEVKISHNDPLSSANERVLSDLVEELRPLGGETGFTLVQWEQLVTPSILTGCDLLITVILPEVYQADEMIHGGQSGNQNPITLVGETLNQKTKELTNLHVKTRLVAERRVLV